MESEEVKYREVKRAARCLQSKVDGGGQVGAEVRPAAWTGIKIISNAEPQDVVRFVDVHLGSYRHDGSADGVPRFTLSERWQSSYQEAAIRQAIEDLRWRLDEWCVERAIIEP